MFLEREMNSNEWIEVLLILLSMRICLGEIVFKRSIVG